MLTLEDIVVQMVLMAVGQICLQVGGVPVDILLGKAAIVSVDEVPFLRHHIHDHGACRMHELTATFRRVDPGAAEIGHISHLLGGLDKLKHVGLWTEVQVR